MKIDIFFARWRTLFGAGAVLCAWFAAQPEARGFDVFYYEFFKGQVFTQSPGAAPVPSGAGPFVFQALAYPILPSYVSGAAIQLPGGASQALSLSAEVSGGNSTTNLTFNASAATQSALDAAYGSGTYTLNYVGQDDGATSVPIALGADAFPPAPAVANLMSAQSINAASNFALMFAPWVGAETNDLARLVVYDAASNIVFSTPEFYGSYPSALSAGASVIVISNGVFIAGSNYTGVLTFADVVSNDISLGEFPILAAGFSSATIFPLAAAPPAQVLPPPVVAPVSISNSFLTLTVSNGGGGFAGSGSYQIFTLPLGSNYLVLGGAGAGFGAGNFAYTPSSSNTAVVNFNDAKLGAVTLTLSYSSDGGGSFVLASSGGTQSGAFTTGAGFGSVAPPNIFLPGITNGQFQCFVSGQQGLTYEVDASSDLVGWSALTNLSLANLSTNFVDGSALPARFYRAEIGSVAFAPTNLTGTSLNCAISGGAAPLAASGLFQFMADTNDDGYQIIAGTGTNNSSGSYEYTVTGPYTALLSRNDSVVGEVVQRLVFTSSSGGYYYATNASGAGAQSGRFTLNSGPTLFFGNAQFTPDTARGNSVYFPATGNAETLSVTDAAGYTWTLNIPGDALVTPTTISMTPFANINSSAAQLPIVSGVQLGPDGLHFCDGLTLTMTAPAALHSHATLLMGNNDGSGLYLVQTTNQSTSYTTTLFHFSSAAGSDPSDQQTQDYINEHLPQAQAAYAQAQSQVKALERPVVQPPEPPDYVFMCDGNPGGDAAASAYAANLFPSETAAIQNLLSCARALTLLTGDESYGDNAIALARELIETACYRKIDSLFSSYGSNPKKAVPVIIAAFSTDRQDELLGGAGRSDWMSQALNWLSGNVLNYYWGQLRSQHDYTMAPVLLQIQRQIDLLGGDGTSDEDFIKQIASAYTFTVTLNISDIAGPDAYVAHTLTIMAGGTVTITGDPNVIFPLRGTNDIDYDSGVYGDKQNYVLQTPLSFSEQIVLPLDICTNSTANIFVYQMGSENEIWNTPDGPDQLQLLSDDFDAAFESGHDGYSLNVDYDCDYYFNVPFQNMDPNPVNSTFTGTGEFEADTTITFTIQVQHTPQ